MAPTLTVTGRGAWGAGSVSVVSPLWGTEVPRVRLVFRHFFQGTNANIQGIS
jgi:hypothetical protein